MFEAEPYCVDDLHCAAIVALNWLKEEIKCKPFYVSRLNRYLLDNLPVYIDTFDGAVKDADIYD